MGTPRRPAGGSRISTEQWRTFFVALGKGTGKREAAEHAKISYSTVMRAYREEFVAHPPAVKEVYATFRKHNRGIPTRDELSANALRALDDFAFFRRRYFGRVPVPWQTDAGYKVAALLESPDREYADMNEPPGSGKSTFWRDAVCWLICRDRAVRVLWGSSVQDSADLYVAQIRRELERTIPIRAPSDLLAKGMAFDADATLQEDFGAFQPTNKDLWRRGEFIVAQPNESATADKEATVAAYGYDSKAVLGGRYDLCVWDDLVTQQTLRVVESRDAQAEWWNDTAENRVEPGGLIVLNGQRLHGDDLHNKVLGKTVEEFDDDGRPTGRVLRVYHHIVYKAHYEEHCVDDHGLRARYYDPQRPANSGCLLDPKRLPWRFIAQEMTKPRFRLVYQQEDIDIEDILVHPLWIAGGEDERGEQFVGCWDADRSAGVMPQGLASPWMSLVTADPSPTLFWAIEWWIFQPELRHLIDLRRKKMSAPELLDWNNATQSFVGILEDWWQVSNDQGAPIQVVIVERNAAQRFLLQYEHAQRWQQARQVRIMAHDTGLNKSDPKLGVQTLGPLYRFGRIRLPGNRLDGSRARMMNLVDEVTKYPEGRTDDTVMAQWFGEWNWPKLYTPPKSQPYTFTRPSWLQRRPATQPV